MKKFICLFLSFIFLLMLTSCSSSKIEKIQDNNNNYFSSDVDEYGNIISTQRPTTSEENNTSTILNDISSEKYSSETVIYKEPTDLAVHFIDCGNADCTFLELPNNKTMLIDAGNNEDGKDICAYIQNLGYSKIDYLIGTHPHEDHIGGLDDIINTFDIRNVYLPRIPNIYVPSTKTYESVLMAISNKNLTITSPTVKQQIVCEEDLIIEVLNDINNTFSENMNDYSLVIKITHKYNSFILCADAEEKIEKEIIKNTDSSDLRCDVLKIGHHGSNTSTSDAWLRKTLPAYAFIPCGKDNEYGHPHDEIVKKIRTLGVKTYRADTDGTVIFISNGENLKVQTKITGDIPLGDPSWSPSMIKAGS